MTSADYVSKNTPTPSPRLDAAAPSTHRRNANKCGRGRAVDRDLYRVLAAPPLLQMPGVWHATRHTTPKVAERSVVRSQKLKVAGNGGLKTRMRPKMAQWASIAYIVARYVRLWPVMTSHTYP